MCLLTTRCQHVVLHPHSAASYRLLLIALIYSWHQHSQMMNESPSQESEKGTFDLCRMKNWTDCERRHLKDDSSYKWMF